MRKLQRFYERIRYSESGVVAAEYAILVSLLAIAIITGATALGIGSKLIRKDLLKDGNYKEISKNIEKCLSWINDARKKDK